MATGAAARSPGEKNYYPDWSGGFAPISKFDAAMGRDPRGPAWKWEYENHFAPSGSDWWGHCNGWAVASFMEAEPVTEGESGGVYFRVGDKKALLTELHQGDAAMIYGRLYAGSSKDDGDDIPPHVFQSVLVENIKGAGKPVVIEIDPSPAVWNFPCYAYDMGWWDEGTTRHVSLVAHIATDDVKPDFLGLTKTSLTYSYDLYYSGGQVVGSAWTGDYPDAVWVPVAQSAANPHIDYDEASSVVESGPSVSPQDDAYEPNDSPEQARQVARGSFFARLFNPDWYLFPAEAGEAVTVTVDLRKVGVGATLLAGSEEAVEVAPGATADVALAKLQEPGEVSLGVVPSGPQANARNYEVSVARSPASLLLPHIANACTWSTSLYVANNGGTPANVYWNHYRTSAGGVGRPVYAPRVNALASGMLAGGEIGTLFDGYDRDCERWLKVFSDEPVDGLAVFSADGGRNLAAMPLQKTASDHWTVDHVAMDEWWWTGFTVANSDAWNPAVVSYQPYTADGDPLPESPTVTIPPAGRDVRMADQIFSAPTLRETAWVEITSDRPVTGFELFGTHDLEMGEGVAFSPGGGTEFMVPWVPPPDGGWWVGITIVNPSWTSATVKITPYMKEGYFALLTPNYQRVVVGGKAKFVKLLDQVFPDLKYGPIAYMKIESDVPVSGFVLYGSMADRVVCGQRFVGKAELASSGILPVVDGLTMTFNNSWDALDATVSGDVCDVSGAVLAPLPGRKVVGGLPAPVSRWSLGEWLGVPPPPGAFFIRWRSDRPIVEINEVLWENRGTAFMSLR